MPEKLDPQPFLALLAQQLPGLLTGSREHAQTGVKAILAQAGRSAGNPIPTGVI